MTVGYKLTYTLMNLVLAREIRKAEKSTGCLITITTYNPENKGRELSHFYQTMNFQKNDIIPSMEKVKEMLRAELGDNISKTSRKR